MSTLDAPTVDAPSPYQSFRSHDVVRTLQLLLGVVWLLDGVLQLQPFMFTPGPSGFSGMISGMAQGAPVGIHGPLSAVASLLYHHPVPANLLFALIQIGLGLGIAYRPLTRVTLAASIVWSVLVWWLGEAAGNLFAGQATPLGGGPGAVLLYALLAVVLWPKQWSLSAPPYAAAASFGLRVARYAWAGLWGLFAVLSVVGQGRQGALLASFPGGLASGAPGWLAHLDHHVIRLLSHHGGAVAVSFAVLCVLIGAAIFAPLPIVRVAVIVGAVLFAVIWVAIENFGGILLGGATDPNSGLLMLLVCACYYPVRRLSPDVSRA